MKEKGSKAKVTTKTRLPVSPHLTLLGIFMWGSEKIYNRHHVHDRVYIAVTTVTQDMICYTWNKHTNQMDVCRTTDNAHTEILWISKKSESSFKFQFFSYFMT